MVAWSCSSTIIKSNCLKLIGDYFEKRSSEVSWHSRCKKMIVNSRQETGDRDMIRGWLATTLKKYIIGSLSTMTIEKCQKFVSHGYQKIVDRDVIKDWLATTVKKTIIGYLSMTTVEKCQKFTRHGCQKKNHRKFVGNSYKKKRSNRKWPTTVVKNHFISVALKINLKWFFFIFQKSFLF